MKEFKVLLDSTCDMTPANLAEFGIDYCRMGVSIGDKEYYADLAWPDMTPNQFYEIMKTTRPYTQLVTEGEFKEKFTKYLDEGKDVLYISCSSGLSGSVNVGRKVAEQLMAERPDAKILIVDSLMAGMGQGFMGIRAVELQKEGKTIDEVVAVLEQEKLKYNQFATVGNLTHLKNAGRVKASAAFFGNIFGVKPIIISDIKGNNFAYKKVRGRQAALEEIANSIVETVKDFKPEEHYLAIDHACANDDDANKIISIVESKGIHFKRIFISPLGPILGASCGPDTITTYCYGKEVTILGE